MLFRPGVDQARRTLRAPLVAGVLVTAGVMGYGYLAYRYTSEFVPALVFGGAVGVCALNHWLLRRPRLVYAAGLVVMAVAMVVLGGRADADRVHRDRAHRARPARSSATSRSRSR